MGVCVCVCVCVGVCVGVGVWVCVCVWVCVGVWVCVCAVIGIRKVSVAFQGFSFMYAAVNVNIPTMFSLYVSTCECIDTVFLSISLSQC